jgi:polyhydroxyalkanoate synthase
LFAYGKGRGGRPVLFIPSLINRAHILDLKPGQSLLRYLARAGLDPWLLDWGEPGPKEKEFSLADYVGGPLEAAIDQVREMTGRKIALVGYCMGGLLAVAAAVRRQEALSALALLATPWDFHAQPPSRPLMQGVEAVLPWVLAAFGVLPVDFLQAFFLGLDPAASLNKFAGFARLDPRSPEAEDFVALEDWVNDGVPLVAKVAEECFRGWYGENQPARRQWRVNEDIVDPARLGIPVLLALPQNDKIVPPASAVALAEAVPGAVRLNPQAGHIGMIVGRRAVGEVWEPLAAWLGDLR